MSWATGVWWRGVDRGRVGVRRLRLAEAGAARDCHKSSSASPVLRVGVPPRTLEIILPKKGSPPAAEGCVAAGGGVVLLVSLVSGGWYARLKDSSECGALGVGQRWGLSHEVLNVRGEGVRAGPW